MIFIFYRLLNIYDKTQWKKELKCILVKLLGVIIPVAIFGIYLIINNIWYDFIDYTILGIKTFSNKISYIYLIKGNYGIIFSILSIIIPIFVIYMYIKTVIFKLKTKEDKVLFVFFVYSVASLIVIYPISDSIHFLIGIIPSLVGLIYIISTRFSNKVFKKILNYMSYMLLIVVAVLNIVSIKDLYNYLKNINNYNQVENFKYISVPSYNSIKEINEFIIQNEKQGKKVYILDASAALYMIPLDKYNKDFDMFNKGNLGSRGEEGQIQNLEKIKENVIVMVKNENYSRNWQNPEKVRTYIINNWLKIGQLEKFDIYMGETND